MKSGTSFLIGGLLQGLGKGITNQHEERRQNALLALKRGYDVADRETAAATAEAAAVSNDARDQTRALGVIEATAAADVAKAGVKANLDKVEAEFKATLDLSHDVSMAKLNAKLDGIKTDSAERVKSILSSGDVQSTRIGAKGELIIIPKRGAPYIATGLPALAVSGDSGDDSGGTIAGARNRQDEPAPAAPKPTLPNLSQQEEGLLMTRWSNASRQTAPYMFNPDGSKKPYAMVKRMMQGRLSQ